MFVSRAFLLGVSDNLVAANPLSADERATELEGCLGGEGGGLRSSARHVSLTATPHLLQALLVCHHLSKPRDHECKLVATYHEAFQIRTLKHHL